VFGGEKPSHVLPRYVIEKLVMQELSYHLSIGLQIMVHREKKAPWRTLPLHIELYKIRNLKVTDVEVKEILRFEFNT